MKKSAIKNRRERVIKYLRAGHTETRIAKTQNVSRQTIVRDVKEIKKDAQIWLDGLANGEFVYEFKLGLDRISETRNRLEKLYAQTEDIEERRRILKSLDDNEKLYLEILGNAPTIHAYRKAIWENNHHV